jgi:hypothetical protein
MVSLKEIEALPESNSSTVKAGRLQSYTDSQKGYPLRPKEAEFRSVDEQVIQKEIIDYLRSRGAWVVKFPAVNLVGSGPNMTLASTVRGVPDLLVCYRGRFLGIEVKAARKGVRVSGEQVAQGELIQRSGGWWIATYNLEKVKELLDSVDSSL